MGGKSSIDVEYDEAMWMYGEIVTNGGGFAGVYTYVDDVDVSSYKAIEVTYEALDASSPPIALELRLDGARDTSGSWVDHRSVFAVVPSSDADGVGTVTIPFEAFVPRWRGNEASGGLDLTAIDEIGLQLLFQEGPFVVAIRKISAVEAVAPPDDPAPALGDAPSPSAVVAAIEATIMRGSYVYNKGYYSQCDKIYAATARGLVASLQGGTTGLKADVRDALEDAIAEADAMGYTEDDEKQRAWQLRYGLDAARAAATSAGESWGDDAEAVATSTPAPVASTGKKKKKKKKGKKKKGKKGKKSKKGKKKKGKKGALKVKLPT